MTIAKLQAAIVALRSAEDLHALGYAEGWRDATEKAAKIVRDLKDGAPTEVTDEGLDWLADRIAAEPAPKKDGK